MRRPSLNPFTDYPFSSWLRRGPIGSSRRGKSPQAKGGVEAAKGGQSLLAENGRLKDEVAELKARLSKGPKEGRGEDPVLLALHLAEEEVFDRKDYGREAVVVTREGRKLKYQKGA